MSASAVTEEGLAILDGRVYDAEVVNPAITVQDEQGGLTAHKRSTFCEQVNGGHKFSLFEPRYLPPNRGPLPRVVCSVCGEVRRVSPRL